MANIRWGRWRCWFNRIRTVEQDWVFYALAFIPFFLISFAVWICLDEAIFALRYRIEIQWSLFPYFRVFPDIWHYLGLFLFILGMIFMGFTLLLNRSSEPETKTEKVQWFRLIRQLRRWLSKTPVLVIFGLISLISLGVAIGCMYFAFNSQIHCSLVSPGIPCFTNLLGLITIESLFLHQIGDVLVAIGLIFIFLVIIGERSGD
ncbi:MAG: hypothetical protein ACFFDU_03935 [Candidatus Thorarchaeota archaeon]